MICCVLKASCADSSDGKDKASSLELVCNDCVPPKIADAASDIFNDAEILVKVKEPQRVEVDMI